MPPPHRRGRVLQKLSLRDRDLVVGEAAAVVYAYESGLIQPGSATESS